MKITDKLIAEAKELSNNIENREMDALLSTRGANINSKIKHIT